jgi:hypothetical protein
VAYRRVLFAIGNDHKGSYYPAALCAVPLLVRVAATCPGWPRYLALEVLTDLLISFGPEPGYEEFGGQPIDLMGSMREALSAVGLPAASSELDAEGLLTQPRAAISIND